MARLLAFGVSAWRALEPATAIACLLYALHQGWERYWPHPLVDGYLDDLCYLPAALGLSRWGLALLLGQPYFRLPLPWMLTTGALLMWAAEWVFPHYSEAFTYDPWDLLAYALGGLLYAGWHYAWVRKKTRPRPAGEVPLQKGP